jgi:PadR family transcriptional regulator, regulatory protein PadR
VTHRALGEFEHHVLLALVRLGKRGDVAAVVEELETVTGKAVSPAAVFIALRRLEQRGLARSQKREAKPGEGGRGRRAFQITAAGTERIRESRRTLERLWGVLGPSAEPR